MNYLDLAAQWEPLIPKILEEMEADMKIGRFVGGPRIERLEEALCAFTGFSHCVCVSTGTMALEVACAHLSEHFKATWGLPNLTFAATAFAALRGGLDVEILESTSIDQGCLQEPRYAAHTIPVDLYGTPTDWNAPALYPLLVDGCQSLGARFTAPKWPSIHVGVGESEVWAYTVSFYPGKNLGSMGEGGALLTHDPELAEFARAYINQGQREKGKHEIRGTNGRMHALQAIPIYHGLQKLDSWNRERRLIAQIYDEVIAGINEIGHICRTLTIPEGRIPTRHVYPIFSSFHAAEIRIALKNAGIPFGHHYPQSLAQSKCFKDVDGPKHTYDQIFNNEISLPIHPTMTDEEVHEVCDVIRGIAEKYAKEPKHDAR